MEIKMTAPSRSLRPKRRPKKRPKKMRPMVEEGSTRSIDGLNINERKTMTAPDKKAYGGKMEKVKKMKVGGSVCRGMGAASRGGNYSGG